MSEERAVIIGGGVAGLATALWLARGRYEVVVVERDPEPPDIAPEEAFECWTRPGVPQFRHAHILLARMQTSLRDHHPEVHEDLQRAGLELSSITDVLPSSHLEGYVPQEDDRDLAHFWGRRATFEYVLRRYVGKLPGVRFVHSSRVDGLVTESDNRRLCVRGVELLGSNRQRQRIEADIVVDSSGKHSRAPQWLQAKGVRVEVERHPSNFVYACRHYRLNDSRNTPLRREGGGNLDYLGFAVFHAEHGHYALTFGCPVQEQELSAAMRRNEGFEALAEQIPVLQQWLQQSVPTTGVLGAGAFENRWVRYGGRGGLTLRGFFPVGDSLLETNPMYGRGCSTAFAQAQVLAETLTATTDPYERGHRYEASTYRLLRPYFKLSVDTDRIYHIRAKVRRGVRVPVPDRVFNYLYEAAWLPANGESLLVAREFIKAQQMCEVSSIGLRLSMILHILRALLRTWLRRSPAPFLPSVPARAAFLRRLAARYPLIGGSFPVDRPSP